MPRVALTRADREAAAIDREIKHITDAILERLCSMKGVGHNKKTWAEIADSLDIGRNALSRYCKGDMPALKAFVAFSYKLGFRLRLEPIEKK